MLEKKEINLKTPIGAKTFANSNEVLTPQQTERVKITGILNSRIEVKPSSDIPAYGFFKLDNQEQEIPVIFRIKDNQENWSKPKISKGSTCLLEGEWKTNKIARSLRPSFTCSAYQILQEPKSLTIQDLKSQINSLLNTSLEKKKEWTERTAFLFQKLETVKELEILSNFGEKYLQAYLLLKSAQYSNYQTEHLSLTNFDQTKYLSTLSQELELVSNHIKAYQAKELTNHE